MMACKLTKQAWRKVLPACAGALLALLMCACAAATRPTDASRPRANQPPYPVTLAASDERRAGTLAAWKTLAAEQAESASPAPELQPVTATLRALPPSPPTTLRLPHVEIKDETQPRNRDAQPSDEEMRESLRRFLETAAPVLGVDRQEVSLIEVTTNADGTRRARYQQKPFDWPLRNGFGVVEIIFAPDLRVTAMSSTAIPDTDRLRRALLAVRQQLTAERAASSLAERAVTYTDASGAQQTRTLTSADLSGTRDLVVYPRRSDAAPDTLELRLAWEIQAGGTGAPLLVYVDAVTGEQLGAAAAEVKKKSGEEPAQRP